MHDRAYALYLQCFTETIGRIADSACDNNNVDMAAWAYIFVGTTYASDVLGVDAVLLYLIA